MTHAGNHHIFVRHGKKIIKKKATPFDHFVLGVSVIYPLSGIPQVIAVFHGDAAGVSILSWCAFLLGSVIFLVYGFIHRVPPMIISNALWILVDSAVVAGILMYSMQIS